MTRIRLSPLQRTSTTGGRSRSTPLAFLGTCVLALLLGSFSAACASRGAIRPTLPSSVSPEEALRDSEADVQAGRFGEALTRVTAVQGERNLAPELRNRSDALADRAVDGLDRAGAARPRASELEELARLDLPLRQRSRLTVLAARAHLDEGGRIQAFKLLRDFEENNPGHPERAGASEVVAEAGFSLIADDGRYGLFRRYRSRGIGALELLVVRYPSHPRCAEAYEALANAYVDRGDLDLAIARLEDLLLYHPRDPRAPGAEARLPRIRMERVARDDYDRSELERARDELSAWLERFEGLGDGTDPILAELTATVRADLARCQLRLANNDLIVARYHRRIDQPFGVRQHAARALDLALDAQSLGTQDASSGGATALIEDAEGLLAWAQAREPEPTDAPASDPVGAPSSGGTPE